MSSRICVAEVAAATRVDLPVVPGIVAGMTPYEATDLIGTAHEHDDHGRADPGPPVVCRFAQRSLARMEAGFSGSTLMFLS